MTYTQNIYDDAATASGTAPAGSVTIDPPIYTTWFSEWGYDAAGTLINRRTQQLSDGTIIQTDYIAGVPQVSLSPTFSPEQSGNQAKIETMFDTDLTTGLITEIKQVSPYAVASDMSVTFGTTVYRTADMTADYTPAGTVSALPIRVALTPEALAVTGIAGVALAAVPANAAYAEVYVEDANIRWTKDGSVPADNNGEQEAAGGTIILHDAAEIAGFMAVPIDGAGVIDGTLTANLTVNYWNIAPSSDLV